MLAATDRPPLADVVGGELARRARRQVGPGSGAPAEAIRADLRKTDLLGAVADGDRGGWVVGGYPRNPAGRAGRATFRRTDGRTPHIRRPTRAEPERLAIYRALGAGPEPGCVHRTVV